MPAHATSWRVISCRLVSHGVAWRQVTAPHGLPSSHHRTLVATTRPPPAAPGPGASRPGPARWGPTTAGGPPRASAPPRPTSGGSGARSRGAVVIGRAAHEEVAVLVHVGVGVLILRSE